MPTLTRQELYDLVWSQPRTDLAARLGVSDVAIGKACVRENIPTPPVGYWARRAAGKPTERPGLPVRLPDQSPVVRFGEEDEGADRAAHTAAPSFVEAIDAQVAAALTKISPFAWRRKLRDPHRALARVLAAENRRVQKVAETGYAFLGPYFADAEHQRQLAIYNVLCHTLDCVWHYADLRMAERWTQDAGNARHLVLSLGHRTATVVLAFADPMETRKMRSKRPPGVLTLHLEAGHDRRHDCHWQDTPTNALESQLADIVAGILLHGERSMRTWLQERHRHALEAVAKAEQERIAAEAEQLRLQAERVAAAERARREALAVEAARWYQAQQIRAYVTHVAAHGMADQEWRAWAQRVADDLDPTGARLADTRASNDASTPN